MTREAYDRMWIVMCLIVIMATFVVTSAFVVSRLDRITVALENRETDR